MNTPQHAEGSLYADPDLYDFIYSWYDEDLAFYVETAQAVRGAVLEAACGTGRILLPTLRAGADIDGFDASAEMLGALRRKAAADGLSPRAYQADMRDFTMPRRYDLITVPFRAFMHLLTTEDQLRALLCFREHLEPGGSLVLNLFYPSASFMAEHDGKRSLEREWADPATGVAARIHFTPHYDRVSQIVTVEREVIRTDPATGAETATRNGFTLRWIYKFEMELLLRAAGFTRWQVWGGFDRRPLLYDTDEMVWATWKD